MDDMKFPWGKAIGIVILVVAALFALEVIGLALGWAWLPFYNFGAHVKETQQAIDITTDAQRCINIDAQWNTLKAQSGALNVEIVNAQEALATYEAKLPKDQTTWSITEQQTDSNLQIDVEGLKQQVPQLQAQYTALVAEPDKQSCLGTIPSFVDIR